MVVRHRAALAVLLLASTLTVMAGSIVMPVLEVIRSAFAVNGTAAGLILTAHGLALAVCSPLAGWIIDRWGVRRPLGVALTLYGCAGGTRLFLDSYPTLIAGRLVFGAAAAVVFTGSTVAILALYDGVLRDRAMGRRSAATSLGGPVWPLLGGALGTLTWHAPFGVYLVGVPLGMAALAVLPEADRRQQTRATGMLSVVRERPCILAFYGLLTLAALLGYALAIFLPQRLGQLGIGSPLLVSLYQVAMGITGTLAGLAYARLRARTTYTVLLRLTATSWMLAFLLLGTAGAPVLLLAAVALLGFGTGVTFPAVTVLINETAPPHLRGQATALSSTLLYSGQFASPLLLGPVVQATSITTGYLVTAAVLAAVLAVLLLTKIPDPVPPTTIKEGGPCPTRNVVKP